MRGARALLNGDFYAVGIIPAYAGSTMPLWVAMVTCRDHPRVCGEHFTALLPSGSGVGSSPRMRGAHNQMRESERVPGIIPAYAGSTPHDGVDGELVRDHPRVCGEHVVKTQADSPR